MTRWGIGVMILAGMPGCSTTGGSHSMMSETATTIDAEGVYVRHLRLRLAPSHTQAFESLMKRCVKAAAASDRAESLDWMCYREPPGRYWIILLSDTEDGFATGRGLSAFVRDVARAESPQAENELRLMLAALEYVSEWEIVFQQKSNWSTVQGMSTSTHPKARVMERSIRPGMEEAFEAALAARTAFLAERGYPLPIEGFATRSGAPGRALQVVFPVDWPSFHAADSFFAFVQSLDEASQEKYAGLKATLMETMSGAEYFDGDFVLELSYGPSKLNQHSLRSRDHAIGDAREKSPGDDSQRDRRRPILVERGS